MKLEEQKSMKIENIYPTSFDWDALTAEKSNGETGYATCKTQNFGSIKLRQVEYSTNYLADHWCDKGHVVIVVKGELIIQHINQTELTINCGSTYVVGDNSMAHKTKSIVGATALIID